MTASNLITALCYWIVAINIGYLFFTVPQLKNLKLFILFIGIFLSCGTHHLSMIEALPSSIWIDWITAVFSFIGATALFLKTKWIQKTFLAFETSWTNALSLAETEGRWKKLFKHSPIGIATVGVDGTWLDVNKRISEITGYPIKELKRTTFQNITHKEDLSIDLDLVRELLSGKRDWYQLKKRYIKKDGSEVWILLIATLLRDSSNNPLYFVKQVLDINETELALKKIEFQNRELEKLKKELEFLALHDPLTGLLNRRGLEITLDETLENIKESETEGAFIYADGDSFKAINDVLGHNFGDEMLKLFSAIFESHAPNAAARIGGDEFAAILKTDFATAIAIADTIVKEIRDCHITDGTRAFRGSISLGLISLNYGNISAGEARYLADTAMYEAKRLGRNRVAAFSTDSMELQKAKKRDGWVSLIWEALEQNKLALFCQEIKSLMEPGRNFCEVLVRYIDENGVIYAAGTFIDAVSRNPSLMRSLDRWILKRVIQTSLEREHDSVTINLSGATLNDEGFVDYAESLIRCYDCDPHRIHFEVTEEVAIEIKSATNILKQLRQLGFKYGLDDIGSGFSSLNYLLVLDPDFIKIDGSFVRQMMTNEKAYQIVAHLISLGVALEASIVAEFVETREISGAISELSQSVLQQGFYWDMGKPCRLPSAASSIKSECEWG